MEASPTLALRPSAALDTFRPSRGGAVPAVARWKPVQFNLKFLQKTRRVLVLAPFPEVALEGAGAAPDEAVTIRKLDAGSEAITMALTGKKPRGEELEVFFTEMERCLRGGISETESIRLVCPNAKSPYFRGVLSGLVFLMSKKGLKMGQAMSEFPDAFDEVMIAMVTAGERSGKQAEVFRRLARRATKARILINKFRMALVGPAITLFFLTAAVLVLHFRVFPDLEKNFAQVRIDGAQLPTPTRIVVGVSNFVRFNPWIWGVPIIGMIAFFVGRKKFFASIFWQKTMIRIPVVGRAYRLVIMSRCLDALALLNGEGVPLDRCFDLAARVAAQVEYREYFLRVYAHIQKGRKPYESYLAERYRIGPEGVEVSGRMKAASATGEIADSLQVASDLMQEQADVRLDALPKLINPTVTVLATIILGLLMTAILLPTFSLLIAALKGGLQR